MFVGLNLMGLAGALTSLVFIWKSFKHHLIVFIYTVVYLILSLFLLIVAICNFYEHLMPLVFGRVVLVFLTLI